MKIILLAACLLIITKVKAIDVDKVQALREYLEKCEQESLIGKIPGVPSSLRSDLVFCAMKNANIVDNLDNYDLKNLEDACDTYTFDPILCRKIAFPCYQAPSLKLFIKSTQKKERILKIIECEILSGIMALVPL